MKIQPIETIKSYCNDHLNGVYFHQMPKWIQFVLFLKRGVYNGSNSSKYSRIICYFNFHSWGGHEYKEWIDGEKTGRYWLQCNRCGLPSQKLCKLQ